MSKQYNLNKSKEAKGYYIDITRPYEQVAQDINGRSLYTSFKRC